MSMEGNLVNICVGIMAASEGNSVASRSFSLSDQSYRGQSTGEMDTDPVQILREE